MGITGSFDCLFYVFFIRLRHWNVYRFFLYNILASIIFYTVPTGREKLEKSDEF